MRALGAFMVVSGSLVAIGYLLYWIFTAVAESIPLPLKIAIGVAVIGFFLLLMSIGRERYRTSKEEEFEEVER